MCCAGSWRIPGAAGVARGALTICHFDPETGEDLRRGRGAREDCEAACYDCLMSYRNQPDHELLDRQLIQPVLSRLSRSMCLRSGRLFPFRASGKAHQAGWHRAGASLASLSEAREHRLPTGTQELIAQAGTRPDFVYAGHYAVIYIDGPIHLYADRHNRDLELTSGSRTSATPSFGLPIRTTGRGPSPAIRVCSGRETRMTFAVGSLVKAREREWVVLPESSDEMLVLRPLGGSDDEMTGIFLRWKPWSPRSSVCRTPSGWATIDPADCCATQCAWVSVQRRPVPFLRSPRHRAAALSTSAAADGAEARTGRLLIADDVGIGKTIEAALIAREMLDRAEVRRMAVVCPPQLAEQWQRELATKFHIDAELLCPVP